jgi:hypothetical protein
MRPEPRAVALDEDARASRVPEDGDQDVERRARAGDVPVERLPERRRVRLVPRRLRIDQDERVVRDQRVRGDDLVPAEAVLAAVLRLPVRVRRRPVPEVRRDLLHVHDAKR